MQHLTKVTIANTEYAICSKKYKVIKHNINYTTNVTGYGGGGYIGYYGGRVNPVHISSSNSKVEDIVLIDSDNKEFNLTLVNQKMNIREGHDVRVVFIDGNTHYHPFLILNDSTCEREELRGALYNHVSNILLNNETILRKKKSQKKAYNIFVFGLVTLIVMFVIKVVPYLVYDVDLLFLLERANSLFGTEYLLFPTLIVFISKIISDKLRKKYPIKYIYEGILKIRALSLN